MRVAGSLLAAAFCAASSALGCDMMQYRRVQASAHVHVFEAAEGTTAVVNGNIVAIVGNEAVLVVDTGQFPGIARRVVADIQAITKAPVGHVVNTHWHGDHLLANEAIEEIPRTTYLPPDTPFTGDMVAASVPYAIGSDLEPWIATLGALAAMKARGASREDAAAQLDTAAFRQRHVTTPMRRAAFDQFFVGPAVARFWPPPPAAPAR